MLQTSLYSKSKNRGESIITIIFKSIQKMLKIRHSIKSIVTLKSKDKIAPNSLLVNGNYKWKLHRWDIQWFFLLVNVGSNLASIAPKGKRLLNAYYTYLRNSVVNSFFINLVQEYKIEKLINILNQNKSIGPYNIPVSFQQGMFPKALKTVRMFPIFKKEDPQFSSNYRHISVLPIFKRLYKVCMYSRLYAFWQNMNCFLKSNLVLETINLQAMHWSV